MNKKAGHLATAAEHHWRACHERKLLIMNSAVLKRGGASEQVFQSLTNLINHESFWLRTIHSWSFKLDHARAVDMLACTSQDGRRAAPLGRALLRAASKGGPVPAPSTGGAACR